MNSSVNYTDFDRIVDTILFLDSNHTLDFCTRLSMKDKNGYRKFYEFESQYQSNQYFGVDIGRSIKRSMSFYYVITNKTQFTGGLVLRANDVYLLHQLIQAKVLPWYFGSTRLFKIKNNRLVIIGEYNPVLYTKDEHNWINFEPIIINYEDGTFKDGIRMTINSNDDFIDLNIDKFLEFYTCLNYQNMYIQSEAQCNYVKTAPYLANNIIIGGGLGSGGGNNHVYNERSAENQYGLGSGNNRNDKSKYGNKNNFLDNAKKKNS
jgi:hypothetical protein